MALDADELVIRPLREVVQRGNDAVTNATNTMEEEGTQGSDGPAMSLAKAGQMLRKEGERALKRLQPLWDAQVAKHGEDFHTLIVHNDELGEKRRTLDDLLYDFEDFVELDDFDEAKFVELQAATKSLALAVIEVVRTAKIKPTQSESRIPSVFPPLPPLPPLPASMATRPDSLSSNAFSVSSHSRSSIRSKDTWPQPPSPSRHRIGGNHAFRADAVPPVPPMNLQFVFREKNGAESSVTSMPSPTTPGSMPSYSDNAEILNAEMGRVNIGQTPLIETPPISPRVEKQGMAFGQRSPVPDRGGPLMDGSASSQPEALDNRSSIYDFYNNQTRSNRASVLSSSNSVPSRTSQGQPNTAQLQTITAIRTPSTVQVSSTSDVSGARSSSSVAEIDNPMEKWTSATTADSHLAASMGYPKWRSVVNRIDPKAKSLCAGAKAFRTGGHWEGVKKVGGASGSTSQASEYSFGQVYASAGPVYAEAMAQCKNCDYANKQSELSDDFDRDHNANYLAEGVRYRRRFLYKSHVATQNMSKAYYACVFCALSGVKIHESDATIFASPKQLFAHLSRHPQPFPEASGLTVLYGDIPLDHAKAGDYDINFTHPPSVSRVPKEARLGFLPVAAAIKDHLQEQGASKLSQPDRETRPLPFFAGARIVGVEFPSKWNGKWCSGWHDGEFGAFPVKAVQLESPHRKGLPLLSTMDSRRSGVTRWKFQRRSGNSTAWLEFDKGDMITNLNWDDSEAWYWSGTNSKGQFGIFPSSHIEVKTIQDGSLETDDAKTSSKKPSRSGKSLFRLKRASTSQSSE